MTKRTKFSQALYEFDAFLETQKNLSPRTRQAYRYDIDRFADFWLQRHGKEASVVYLDAVSMDDIKFYLEHLRMDLQYRSTTLSRTIASIRIFFEFCVVERFLESSPATHLHNPKNPRRLPIFLIESELKRLFQAPTLDENAQEEGHSKIYPHLVKRDYAILVTLGFTGLRLSELVGLNLRDCDLESQAARVLGKGSKERIVPLNEIVIHAIRDWLVSRAWVCAEGEQAVFVNKFGRRISTRGVEQLVEKHVQSAGIEKDKISPHKLRHTFATLLHMNDVDIVEIQALLGHSSITSTQIYTHVSSSRLKKAVKKLEDI